MSVIDARRLIPGVRRTIVMRCASGVSADMKMSIIVGITLLTRLTGGPARGALSEDETTAAEAAAKAHAATPAGEKYQATVGQAFGRDHGVTVGQCAKATRRPDLSAFDLLLRVEAEGVVEEVLVKPRTNLSGCVQGKLTGWKVPGPPHAGIWVRVAVNLKRK